MIWGTSKTEEAFIRNGERKSALLETAQTSSPTGLVLLILCLASDLVHGKAEWQHCIF